MNTEQMSGGQMSDGQMGDVSQKNRGSGADAWPMIEVNAALKIVLNHAQALPAVQTQLADVQGMYASETIYAAEPLPPFVASVKDGYAVIASEDALDLEVVASVTAGEPSATPLQQGQAAYITTGAPLPLGANAVIQVEDTERYITAAGIERVRLQHFARIGNDLRPIGSDIAPGDLLVPAGQRFGPAEIGLAATMGVRLVMTHRRPRVGILSTGNELLGPDDLARPGAIRDSNGAMLAAAVRAAGAEVVDYGIAPDRIELLRAIINDAQRDCDLLITTGGVSMGELDLMKGLAAELGEVHFGRLLMKPGKPCTFATLPRIVGVNEGIGSGAPLLFFGLPGNPVSALVTFYLLTLPAIRKMAGSPTPNLVRVQAILAESLNVDAVRTEYHRGALTWDSSLNSSAGGWRAKSTGIQVSSRLASFQRANALMVLPPGPRPLAPGALVDALLLPGGLEATP